VADDQMIKVDAFRLEDVELLHRRFAVGRVREDRQASADVGLADGAQHLTLVGRDVVGRTDLAEGAPSLIAGVTDELLDQLGFRHLGNPRRIRQLSVVAALHNRHAGFARQEPQELDVGPHVGVPTVDDAADAVLGGDLHLLGHPVEVLHHVGTGQRFGQR
jgi:hypothetical protein